MQRDQVYLLDILEAARLAVSYVHQISTEAFLRDTQLQELMATETINRRRPGPITLRYFQYLAAL